MEKPSRGGEKRTAVWASPHEGRGSDGAVALPLCDHRVVLHRCVMREWCHPSGSTVVTCLNAAARTRRAARAVQGDVVSVWQVLHGTPRAPPNPAQRVARFDDHCTRNCLRKNKLRQRYSRFIARKNWRRSGVSPLHCSAHLMPRGEPPRCLLVPMDTIFDLPQTAIH